MSPIEPIFPDIDVLPPLPDEQQKRGDAALVESLSRALGRNLQEQACSHSVQPVVSVNSR
jgi:hypothetical protein